MFGDLHRQEVAGSRLRDFTEWETNGCVSIAGLVLGHKMSG
jgi:hypothetical protein